MAGKPLRETAKFPHGKKATDSRRAAEFHGVRVDGGVA